MTNNCMCNRIFFPLSKIMDKRKHKRNALTEFINIKCSESYKTHFSLKFKYGFVSLLKMLLLLS